MIQVIRNNSIVIVAVIYSCILFTIGGCEKSEFCGEDLIKYTFDGTEHIISGPSSGGGIAGPYEPGTNARFIEGSGEVTVSGSETSSGNGVIIKIIGFNGLGEYKLVLSYNGTAVNSSAKLVNTDKIYVTDSDHIGTIEVAYFDAEDKIIGGNFNFTGVDAQSGEQVTVSSGWFDLNY